MMGTNWTKVPNFLQLLLCMYILIGSTSGNSPKPRCSKKICENAIAISMNILNLTLHYNYIAKKLKTQKVMKNMIK